MTTSTIPTTTTLQPLLADYFRTQPVVRAWLFGSFARGSASTGSDIDVLVELDDSANIGLVEFIRIKQGLERLLEQQVDVVSIEGLSPYIKPHIDKEKVLMYER
jgi:predicted nucleotidyltransferase